MLRKVPPTIMQKDTRPEKRAAVRVPSARIDRGHVSVYSQGLHTGGKGARYRAEDPIFLSRGGGRELRRRQGPLQVVQLCCWRQGNAWPE